jgi:protein-tyrosine phosphatase
MDYNFGPAYQTERTVYGAERPGYPSQNVSVDGVENWITFMKDQEIKRVCCLLNDDQLAYYPDGLVEAYRQSFGAENVCLAPIKDYHLAAEKTLIGVILPFLIEASQLQKKAVVHCSGGMGRTGHVLVAWLVYSNAMELDDAIQAVRCVPGVSRNPREAIGRNASEKQFQQLFETIAALRKQG